MISQNLEENLHQTWSYVLKQLKQARDSTFEYNTPKELNKKLGTLISLDTIEKNLEKILTQIAGYTPDTSSPFYLNYFYSTPDPVGLIGDWFISLMNTNVHAYEASPVFALTEMELIRALSSYVGYRKKSDGIICPGGSYSNMFALYLAIKRNYPDAVLNGISKDKKPVIFASEESHYSIDRGAAFSGIGRNNVRKIRCDKKGRMIPDDLENNIQTAISSGKEPFFVHATIGTTVLGAFDPLSEIQEVLKSYPQIWLHADAAWGGAVFMSQKHKNRVKGIEMADSITWDMHKALNAPLLCSALLVKDSSYLKNIFMGDTSYLFHNKEEEKNCNLGEKTPQCGRRGDAFKFWLMLKVRGDKYFETHVEKIFKNSADAVNIIEKKESFWIYDDAPDFCNICFWYIPSHMKNKKCIENLSDIEKSELENLNINICRYLRKNGKLFVNFSKIKELPSFIRLIVSRPDLNSTMLKKVCQEIEQAGDILTADLK